MMSDMQKFESRLHRVGGTTRPKITLFFDASQAEAVTATARAKVEAMWSEFARHMILPLIQDHLDEEGAHWLSAALLEDERLKQ